MRRVIIAFLCLIAYALDAQVTGNVRDFGATGDGTTDDRAAIQSTINYVHDNGGGTVFFPSGTYLISPLADPDPKQVICLKLYDNIALVGVSRDSSVIKLINNSPNFDAMVGNNPSYQKIDNIQLKDLCFDANGMNNPVSNPSILSNGTRSIFRIFLGENYIIENCRFTNHKGVWCIVFNGLTENIIIRNNEFTNIGDDNVEWDHSSIYTNGDNFIVEKNYFRSLSGPGTKAARTAIEVHGSNQIIRNNTIVAYPYGINVTGYSELYASYNQTYHNNTFLDVMDGLVLWSNASSDPVASNGLKDIKIFDNAIQVNSTGWKNYAFFDGGAGIVFERNRDLAIDSLYIFNNDIHFVGSPINSAPQSRYSNGITMGDNNIKGVDVRNAYILNNTVRNSNGPGINLDFKFSNAIISNNLIENAGSSQANLFTGFRSGIYVGDTITHVQINCNRFNKTNNQSNIAHLLYNNGTLISDPYFFNNQQAGYSSAIITNGSYASGLTWIQTPNKPIVVFNQDSTIIYPNQTAQITLALDQPATNALRVSLLGIDESGIPNLNWLLDSVVVFNPGEQLKNIAISTVSHKNQTNYLIIKNSTDYLVGCNALLKIKFNSDPLNLEQTPTDKEIRIYPNPAEDYFSISDKSGKPYRITLYNVHGQILLEKTVFAGDKISLNHLPKGFYIVSILNKESSSPYSSHKLILK